MNQAIADNYYPNDYYASIEKANNPDWMKDISDNISIKDLSIPGTHDTMAVWGNLSPISATPNDLTADVTKVQQRFKGRTLDDHGNGPDSLKRQLEAGIRAIDIRVRIHTNKKLDGKKIPPKDQIDARLPFLDFLVVHGSVYQHANFNDVINKVSDFLKEHPNEVVLMRYKLDAGNDEDSAAFTRLFDKYINDSANKKIFYQPSIRGDHEIDIPHLKDVRGKIVLLDLRGKGGGHYDGYGINEDSTNIQDDYELNEPSSAANAKFNSIAKHFIKTKKEIYNNALMVNYTSASAKIFGIPTTREEGPSAIAHDVNQRVWTYLDKDYADQSRTGIIMMDYPGWKLIEKIISFNKNIIKSPNTSDKTTSPKIDLSDASQIPDLGNEPSTFRVNAGSTSFTASLPANSVATYVWKDGEQPRQWVTTADGAGFRYALREFALTSRGNPSDTIDIGSNQHQQIDGFGAALTDSAAQLIARSPKRNEIMSRLFGSGSNDAHLTFARVPMGSSDMMYDGGNLYTYEDTPGNFSTDRDRTTLDILKQAKGIVGNDLKIVGTPWTIPGWMKNGGKLLASKCGTAENQISPQHYDDYVNYFNKYIDEYTSKGLRPWMVSLQNEPENCKTDMPTTQLTSNDEVILSKKLRARLPGDIKILGWDHNWDNARFVDNLTRNGSVDAIGYHGYVGTNYKDQTTAKPTYVTEATGTIGDGATDVAFNMGWEVSNLLIGPMRFGSQGSFYWSMAQRADGSPHLNGTGPCPDCRGMVTITNNDRDFELSQDFYFYAHFSKFIDPGSVRVDSSQSGNLSTVAFKKGDKNILVVLNSSHKADGGNGSADRQDLVGHIVQYNGDESPQKTAWLVGSDNRRRWIGDGSTFNCLKYDAGMKGPDSVSAGNLDQYYNEEGVWATCGNALIGTKSQLEVGTYLKSTNGARLTLTQNGLIAKDASGNTVWAPSGRGTRLILQEDQNLVLYDGDRATWASNTVNSGAIWLAMRDDGSFALFDKDNKKVWGSPIDTGSFKGQIVQYEGDKSAQKTSWLVGADNKRRWIHDWSTFQCLKDAGWHDARSVSSDVLDQFDDLNNVWATCGSDRLGANGALEKNSSLKAGDYTLTLTDSDLTLKRHGETVWSTGRGGEQLIFQPDGNLVIYDGNRNASWASGTWGRFQAGWVVLSDDGALRLFDSNNHEQWSSDNADSYKGKIVEMSGDQFSQKTSWLVGADGKRRWIHDWQTFQCLKDAGWDNSKAVSHSVLNRFEDLDNVWASCGNDRLGPNGALEKGSSLKAGDYTLTLTDSDLVLKKKGNKVWSTGRGGEQLIFQPDGNLVIYDGNRNASWASGTWGRFQAGWVVLGDDGSLRLYDKDNHEQWHR